MASRTGAPAGDDEVSAVRVVSLDVASRARRHRSEQRLELFAFTEADHPVTIVRFHVEHRG